MNPGAKRVIGMAILALCCQWPLAGQVLREIDDPSSGDRWLLMPGTGQPGNWLSGIGGGLLYRAKSDRWKVIVDYGYGLDAIRDGHRGANTIGVLLQIDLDKMANSRFHPLQPGLWRGWHALFGN